MRKDKLALLVDSRTTVLFEGIDGLIEQARKKVSVYLNQETSLLYWAIGHFINSELKTDDRLQYGAKILATLSQQLSWSHLIELATIENQTKRQFYSQMSMGNGWGVRELRNQIDKMAFERTAMASKTESEMGEWLIKKNEATVSPDTVFKSTYILDFLDLPYLHSEKQLENAIISQIEQFILELGNGFAFLERQKRISVDAIDYHLDLLFYHRKLNRLIAIDLKIGKFKPEHKAQMELYLRYLQKNDKQPQENNPIGLLLCSEGNTEHIELLMLGEENIRVAQYLTELPDKQWFIDKMHRAIEISKQNLQIAQ